MVSPSPVSIALIGCGAWGANHARVFGSLPESKLVAVADGDPKQLGKLGALYPGLFRLVRQGLLKASWGTSENNRRAKFYELTVAGRKRLREETANWNRLATAIGSALAAQRS